MTFLRYLATDLVISYRRPAGLRFETRACLILSNFLPLCKGFTFCANSQLFSVYHILDKKSIFMILILLNIYAFLCVSNDLQGHEDYGADGRGES